MATTPTSFNKVPAAKNTLCVAQGDGRVYLVDFSEFPQLDDPGEINWDLSVSKLILAKVQQSRNNVQTLEAVEIENIVHTDQFPEGATQDMKITVFASQDGKNVEREVVPHTAIDSDGFVRAHCRVTARNFSIQLRGTYNINTMTVVYHLAGRR